jgi:hypothetical protein
MRMPNTGTQRGRKAQSEATKKWLAVLCACSAWTSGCFLRRTPAKQPTISFVGVVHPVIPPGAVDPVLEPPPEISFDVPPAPPQLVTSRSAPARPRVAPPPAPEPAATEKLPQHIIAPEVTTEEQMAAQAEMQHSLDLVEKNLALAWGKNLNATQKDLVSKIRGFTENAQEAMRSGDWMRAKNLSKKAEVLSDQLAASF